MGNGKFKKRLVLLCAGIAFLGLLLWTIWGNTALTVNRMVLSDRRIPSGFSGFRIVQVSDLHNAEFGHENADLLGRIAEAEPDILVITGDLIDSNHTDPEIALTFVKKAAELAPVYYVTGNHEAALPRYELLREELKASGAVVLEDESVQLERGGDRITLIGLADPDFTIRGDLFGTVPAMIRAKLADRIGDEHEFTILLAHRPELFEVYAESGVDLVFSGHSHGGQFRLPFTGGLYAPNQGFFPRYDAGLYSSGNTRMVVSRGIGNSLIPLRFNNRPEIILAELSQ